MSHPNDGGFCALKPNRRIPLEAGEALSLALSVIAEKYDIAVVVLAAPLTGGDVTLYGNLSEDEAVEVVRGFAANVQSEN